MRITVQGDNGDHPDNVTELAAKLEMWVGEEFGDIPVTVKQSQVHVEREALAAAIERLEALGITAEERVYVDDENRRPSYARFVGDMWDASVPNRELDDEELDDAVAWLPPGSILNEDPRCPRAWNPYITLAHLRTLEVS